MGRSRLCAGPGSTVLYMAGVFNGPDADHQNGPLPALRWAWKHCLVHGWRLQWPRCGPSEWAAPGSALGLEALSCTWLASSMAPMRTIRTGRSRLCAGPGSTVLYMAGVFNGPDADHQNG